LKDGTTAVAQNRRVPAGPTGETRGGSRRTAEENVTSSGSRLCIYLQYSSLITVSRRTLRDSLTYAGGRQILPLPVSPSLYRLQTFAWQTGFLGASSRTWFYSRRRYRAGWFLPSSLCIGKTLVAARRASDRLRQTHHAVTLMAWALHPSPDVAPLAFSSVHINKHGSAWCWPSFVYGYLPWAIDNSSRDAAAIRCLLGGIFLVYSSLYNCELAVFIILPGRWNIVTPPILYHDRVFGYGRFNGISICSAGYRSLYNTSRHVSSYACSSRALCSSLALRANKFFHTYALAPACILYAWRSAPGISTSPQTYMPHACYRSAPVDASLSIMGSPLFSRRAYLQSYLSTSAVSVGTREDARTDGASDCARV